MSRLNDPITANSVWHASGPLGVLPQDRNDQMAAYMSLMNKGFYRLAMGTVSLVCPAHGYYLVSIPGQDAAACFDTSGGFGAVKVFQAYTPGTQVMVALPENPCDDEPGMILCAGSWFARNDLFVPSWMYPFSSLSWKDDEMVMTLWNAEARGGMVMNGSGRPADLMAGDWQVLNEMDGGMGVGLLKVWAGFGDMCGLEAYFDGLLRLRGRHLDIQTMGYERRILNDTSVVTSVERSYLYGWESLGLGSPGEATREGRGEFRTSATEPVLLPAKNEEFQMGRPRFWRFEGGLAQGRREMVVLPAEPDAAVPYSRHEGETRKAKWLGLYEHYVSPAGESFTRSAHSVVLEKTNVFPAVLPLREPDDPDGTLDPLTEITTKQIETATWPTYEASHLATVLMDDYCTYVLNHKSLQVFQAADRDWRYMQDSELADMEDLGEQAMKLERLHRIVPFDHEAYATLPPSGTLDIDMKVYGQARFFCTKSRIAMNPDGSVAIQDGYGSEILLAGGNITISCAGDTFLRAGRSIINLAASDIILRAGGNVEASSSLGDVRVKAERNALIMAGNGGQGGILLESKSVSGALKQDLESDPPVSVTDTMQGGSGNNLKLNGVLIKTPNAPLVSIAAEQRHKTQAGPFTFKTSNGEQPLFLVEAGNIRLNAASVAYMQGSTCQVKSSETILEGYLQCKGNAFFTGPNGSYGSIQVDGGISAVTGSLNTPWQYFESSRSTLSDRVDTLAKRREEDDMDPIQKVHEVLFNDDFQKNLVFSFRSSSELPVPKPLLPESLWQRMYRQQHVGRLWQEPAVTINDQNTYPWPGATWWNVDDKGMYLTCDPVLTEKISGRAADRPYKTEDQLETLEVESKRMSEAYLITFQPETLIKIDDDK